MRIEMLAYFPFWAREKADSSLAVAFATDFARNDKSFGLLQTKKKARLSPCLSKN